MEFADQIDLYCERLGPEFWAEPINAVTNLAFVLAAIWAMARLKGSGLTLGWGLAWALFAIGIGSFLFHTFATGWAALSDVIPIALFILGFVFATHRDMFGWSNWAAGLAVLAFMPYLAGAGSVFARLPFFDISAAYWPVVLALLLYAPFVSRKSRSTAFGFGIGAAILTASLIARSVDMAVCPGLPIGTHFLWHLLNAVMLATMIEVYRRHMLAGQAGRG